MSISSSLCFAFPEEIQTAIKSKGNNPDSLIDRMFNVDFFFTGRKRNDRLDIDDLFDLMNYVFCNMKTKENNMLQYSIFGQFFLGNNKDFQTGTFNDIQNVKAIANQLNNTCSENLANTLTTEKLVENEVYHYWDIDQIIDETRSHFKNCYIELKDFYNRAAEQKMLVFSWVY